MNWFSKLFNKKSTVTSPVDDEKSKIKWEGHDAFQKGQESFLNGQVDEALIYFDKAFEYGFEENFKYDAAKLFDFRGGCLQTLEYHYDAIKDFDESILLDPNDCNKYLARSVSKGWILDYVGEIADLKKAIEVSKEDNKLNRAYNDEAQKRGYSKISDMYQMRILRAETCVSEEKDDNERINNASTPEDKEFWRKMFNEKKEKRLKQIKRREL